MGGIKVPFACTQDGRKKEEGGREGLQKLLSLKAAFALHKRRQKKALMWFAEARLCSSEWQHLKKRYDEHLIC